MNLLKRIKIAFSDKALNQELDKRVDEIVIPLRDKTERVMKDFFDTLDRRSEDKLTTLPGISTEVFASIKTLK